MPQVIDVSIAEIPTASSGGSVLQLYSPHSYGASYDVSSVWTVDINLLEVGSLTAGTLEVYLQNDDPLSSTYVTDPVLSFPITAGTFANGQTKQTVTNDTFKLSRSVYFLWKINDGATGTGTIVFDGFRSLT